MERRDFLKQASLGLAAAGAPPLLAGQDRAATPDARKPRDYRKEPFERLVILGESTVAGGPWLARQEDRFADVLVRLINACQDTPVAYVNKGIINNNISPRSPGYVRSSTNPSALERYQRDVIAYKPDLFILAYGLNDMRAGMPIQDFRQDMATILRDVQKASSPVCVLPTVYYMTGYRSYPPTNKGGVELTLRFNDCIRSLADEYDCILADVWQAEGAADWLIHYDGVHAHKVGNLLIAHRIFEAIASHASGVSVSTLARERTSEWTDFTTKLRAEAGDPFKPTW